MHGWWRGMGRQELEGFPGLFSQPAVAAVQRRMGACCTRAWLITPVLACCLRRLLLHHRYVYERLTPPGQKPTFMTLMVTQLVSGVWHGLYPGYIMFFAGKQGQKLGWGQAGQQPGRVCGTANRQHMRCCSCVAGIHLQHLLDQSKLAERLKGPASGPVASQSRQSLTAEQRPEQTSCC